MKNRGHWEGETDQYRMKEHNHSCALDPQQNQKDITDRG